MKFLKGLKRSHMIVLAIGLIIIVGAVVVSGKGVVGHSLKASTLYEYPYEGFEQVMDAYQQRTEKKEKPEESWTDKLKGMFWVDAKKTEDSDKKEIGEKKKEGFAEIKDKKDKEHGEDKKENFEPMEQSDLKKISGFHGLFSSPYKQEQLSNFGFNAPPGSDGTKCKNYGYTNSKGNVCFTDEEQKMLETRGGNYSPNILGSTM